jgi:hypothetical protein
MFVRMLVGMPMALFMIVFVNVVMLMRMLVGVLVIMSMRMRVPVCVMGPAQALQKHPAADQDDGYSRDRA